MHISDQLWDEFWKGIVMVLALLAVLGIGTVIVRSASASGQIEYCYVEYSAPSDMPPVYKLKGFRVWRDDRSLGVFHSYEEPLAMAEAMRCPLLKKDAKLE